MTADGLQFSVDEALAYLRKVDPVLDKVIEQVGPFALQPRPDAYASLIRTILFQQLAGAAANAIQKRWLALYGYGPDEGPPAPEQIVSTTEEQFRAAGVSRQKLGYLRDLALHVLDGRLDFAALPALEDSEVAKRLTAVKGLGEWSAHMFLMFHLGRPDVLPTGDLGMRNGNADRIRTTGDADTGRSEGNRREVGAVSVRGFVVYVARDGARGA